MKTKVLTGEEIELLKLITSCLKQQYKWGLFDYNTYTKNLYNDINNMIIND